MYFMGIDPGLDGAIALWMPGWEAKGMPSLPDCMIMHDMPVVMGEVSGKPRRMLDRVALRGLFDNTFSLYGKPKRVVIEKVGAMPGQSGMFAFGFGVGCTIMALEHHGLTVDDVSPQKWKKDLRVPREKDRSLARAAELFPNHATMFHVPHAKIVGRTVARPDRAEAAMLALWAERFAS